MCCQVTESSSAKDVESYIEQQDLAFCKILQLLTVKRSQDLATYFYIECFWLDTTFVRTQNNSFVVHHWFDCVNSIFYWSISGLELLAQILQILIYISRNKTKKLNYIYITNSCNNSIQSIVYQSQDVFHSVTIVVHCGYFMLICFGKRNDNHARYTWELIHKRV